MHCHQLKSKMKWSLFLCRTSERLERSSRTQQSSQKEGEFEDRLLAHNLPIRLDLRKTSWVFGLQMPENFTLPAPITAPIMAPFGDPQVPAAQTMQTLQPQQQGLDQPVRSATFTPIQQQPLGPPGRNPSMPLGNMEGAPGAPIGDVIKVGLGNNSITIEYNFPR